MATPPLRSRTTVADPDHQAFLLLRIVFNAAPIAFGLDKSANWLTAPAGHSGVGPGA